MAGRRELERRMHALDDIDTILGVMKNLALMEAGKLSRLLVAQREMVTSLEETAANFQAFYPQPRKPALETHVILLLGSQRGLCGDFNDLILRAMPLVAQNSSSPLKIAIGAKLVGRLQAEVYLDGPHAVEEIGQVIHEAMNAISNLLNRTDNNHPLKLSALYHDPDSWVVEVKPLAPFIARKQLLGDDSDFAPHLNIAPTAFFARLSEQHLLAAITEILHRSLMAESRFRLNHIEGASRRIERNASELKRKLTLVRQEEIVEEIEAILAGVGFDDLEAVDVKPSMKLSAELTKQDGPDQ